MKLSSILKLKDDEGFEIVANYYFNENEENDLGELKFENVMSGSETDTIENILQGWKEQNTEDQLKWEELVEKISRDEEIAERIYYGNKVIEY